MRRTLICFHMFVAFFGGALISHVTHAGDVPVLTEFKDSTAAKAAEVNGNFAAIRDAVNTNNGRLGALETTVNNMPAGVAGPVGPAGPQGAAGPVGPQGATGPQGLTGPQGTAGATGPAGAMGQAGPVGAIIAWNKSATGTPALPDGWLECNGQVVFDTTSPYYQQTVPSLNGTNLFLRGATASGATGGSAAHTHTFTQTPADMAPDASHYADGSYVNPANHLPPYFDIVWIIRIK